ncbi:MAG: 4Fe-4S dicluster domain-containing protein [Nitrospirota bacterium]|nr:4Fe-4S dicluster domain-containing protein [Nitrospirota bacterium]
MIFKIINKRELPRFFDVLAVNSIIGPVQKGTGKDGAPIYAFEYVTDFRDLKLDYTTTTRPAKRYFLPSHETFCTFRVEENGWDKSVDYNIHKPHIFFGLHACDINALNKLDKVLLQGNYPTPYYAAKRRNMFIIGMECMPHPSCFCRSMGTDSATSGFDMYITDIGDRYFVEVQSAAAFNLLERVKTRDPGTRDHNRYMEVIAEKNKRFTTSVDTTDLAKILDMEFQADIWKYWGDRCLSCGTCASVCPSCYCYGVEESVDIDLKGAIKVKHLYSCNLIDFAEVAGGHNFRPDSHTRLKYRYYHKHRGFVEEYEESLCVGCGRCSEACLARITVPEVIASVRSGERP